MKKIKIAEPHNNKHLEMIEEFEQQNNIQSLILTNLKNIRETLSKEEYEKKQQTSNEIQQILFIEKDGIIKDYCYIQAEKDRKICHLIPAPLKVVFKNRNILSEATNYAFEILGMNDLFITTSENLEYEGLEREGFTNIGENEGETIFLKQREDQREYNKTI